MRFHRNPEFLEDEDHNTDEILLDISKIEVAEVDTITDFIFHHSLAGTCK